MRGYALYHRIRRASFVDPGVYGGDPMVDPFGGNYEFGKLAKATGGRTLYGRNDVDMEINTAIQDGANFYTLTYRPANTSLDPQKFRRIKITVDRPGLSVITREGYYLQYGPGRVESGESFKAPTHRPGLRRHQQYGL